MEIRMPTECTDLINSARHRSVERWMQQSRKPTDDWIKIKYLLASVLSSLSLSLSKSNEFECNFIPFIIFASRLRVSVYKRYISSIRSQSKLDLLTHCHLYKFTAFVQLSRETQTKRKSFNKITWRISFFRRTQRKYRLLSSIDKYSFMTGFAVQNFFVSFQIHSHVLSSFIQLVLLFVVGVEFLFYDFSMLFILLFWLTLPISSFFLALAFQFTLITVIN